MAVDTKVLKIFIELQQRDLALDALRAERRALEPETEQAKSELLSRQSGLTAHRDAHKKLLLRRKELERELQEKEAEIKKHQGELNNVKTNDAYRALQTEINALKARADEAETAILSNMEEAEASAEKEKQLSAGFARDEKIAAQKLDALKEKAAGLDARIASALHERANLLAGVCADELLAKYEYLRANREGLAVCGIKQAPTGAICLACNMRLPPHISMDLRKRGEVVQCDSCQRILYTKETIGEAAGENIG
jgi:hypothetical protein